MLAVICGLITMFAYGFEHADWAARGVPHNEHMKDEAAHFIPGMLTGLALSPIITIVVYWVKPRGISFEHRYFRSFDKDVEWLIGFYSMVISLPFLIFVDNGYLTIVLLTAAYVAVRAYFIAFTKRDP